MTVAEISCLEMDAGLAIGPPQHTPTTAFFPLSLNRNCGQETAVLYIRLALLRCILGIRSPQQIHNFISESFSYESQHVKDAVDIFSLEEGLILNLNSYEFPLDSVVYLNNCIGMNVSFIVYKSSYYLTAILYTINSVKMFC